MVLTASFQTNWLEQTILEVIMNHQQMRCGSEFLNMFRVSEYVQDLIIAGPGAENLGLYIYTYSGAFNAKRWIFHGPDSPEVDKRIRLEIIYSQIDD